MEIVGVDVNVNVYHNLNEMRKGILWDSINVRRPSKKIIETIKVLGFLIRRKTKFSCFAETL